MSAIGLGYRHVKTCVTGLTSFQKWKFYIDPYHTITAMSFPMLPLFNAYIGYTRSVGDGDLFLAWTPGGSTIFIRKTHLEEIELRLDRDVCEVMVS
jgi:hypothetical protein